MTQREKLIDLLNDGCNSCEKAGDKSITEFLADYLIENNVIPLELKPGDTVYIKGKAVKVSYVYIGAEVFYCIHQHCYDTHCHDCPLYFLGDENCDGYFEFKADDIGKTVFLTKECKND